MGLWFLLCRDQRGSKEQREISAQLDLQESLDQLDHLDLRENLAFQDDLVVQASMGGKARKETHLVNRDPPARQDLQADQGSSTAPKEPCSPSLPDPIARCL